MKLIEALKKQMEFCETLDNYKCAVYVLTEHNKNIVMKVIYYLLPVNKTIKVKDNRYESLVQYSNGNIIRIVFANESVRGCRFNGVIIDSDINQETINTIILPCLMPLIKDGKYSHNDNPRDRKYICYICNEDLVDAAGEKMLKDFKKKMFEKEEEDNMFTTNLIDMNGNDRAYITKEINNDKVIVFLAMGIPKENITYETEFVNKTKQTYLNIKGEIDMEALGFKNSIDIHLHIDTDIYDGYDVWVDNGLVFVRLHEIINEAPVLKDYGKE